MGEVGGGGRGLLDPLMLNMTSSSLSLLFIHGENNQAKYTVCNILKMFTNYSRPSRLIETSSETGNDHIRG